MIAGAAGALVCFIIAFCCYRRRHLAQAAKGHMVPVTRQVRESDARPSRIASARVHHLCA